MAKKYEGRCFCGAVEIEVTGDPAAMGYCHCDDCRHWSAAPVSGFSLWPPDQVKVTKGEEHVGSFAKTEQSHRKWCTRCGGHLFSEHPGMGLTDVYAAIIPDFPFEPGMHVFYGEKMLRIHDGVVKHKDMPKEAGGSGEVLAD